MTLTLYAEDYAVCKLAATSNVPDWVCQGHFYTISHTEDELSVVCASSFVPPAVKAETGWRAFKVQGPLAFSEIGIIASLTALLAQASVSVFVVSTFDTDYIMVKATQLDKALLVREEHHELIKR